MYTIKDLANLTGYAEGTIKQLVVDGIMPRAIRGPDHRCTYPPNALDVLNAYKALIQRGMKRRDVIAKLRAKVSEVAV